MAAVKFDITANRTQTVSAVLDYRPGTDLVLYVLNLWGTRFTA